MCACMCVRIYVYTFINIMYFEVNLIFSHGFYKFLSAVFYSLLTLTLYDSSYLPVFKSFFDMVLSPFWVPTLVVLEFQKFSSSHFLPRLVWAIRELILPLMSLNIQNAHYK